MFQAHTFLRPITVRRQFTSLWFSVVRGIWDCESWCWTRLVRTKSSSIWKEWAKTLREEIEIEKKVGRMAKHSVAMAKKRWPLMLLAFLSVSTLMVLFMRPNNSDSCNTKHFGAQQNQIRSSVQLGTAAPPGPSPLDFMKSKLVLVVSHELSLSGFFIIIISRIKYLFFFFRFDEKWRHGLDSLTGGPLLLMELAFLLRGVGSDVVWITNQYPSEPDQVIYSLENKMLDRGVQVILFSFITIINIYIYIWVYRSGFVFCSIRFLLLYGHDPNGWVSFST